MQILKISKLLNFSKFEAVTLPSPSSKVPQRMPKPVCPCVRPCVCPACVYTPRAPHIKYMAREFGVSLPQILELEHQTCWVLYTHIGPPNPPILAPCARAMPAHGISALPLSARAVWLRETPARQVPGALSLACQTLPEFSLDIWTLFPPPPMNYGSTMWVGRNSEVWGVLGLIGDGFANPPAAPQPLAPHLSFFAPNNSYMGASGGCIQWSTSMTQFGCGLAPPPLLSTKRKIGFLRVWRELCG